MASLCGQGSEADCARNREIGLTGSRVRLRHDRDVVGAGGDVRCALRCRPFGIDSHFRPDRVRCRGQTGPVGPGPVLSRLTQERYLALVDPTADRP